jgi:hypothetical protein
METTRWQSPRWEVPFEQEIIESKDVQCEASILYLLLVFVLGTWHLILSIFIYQS